MGFAAGFAGGVTLTLSLTYLALHTHSRNRQAQSAVLRAQTSTLDALSPEPTLDGSLPSSSPQQRRRRNATVLLPDGTYRPRASLEQYLRDEASSSSSSPPSSSFIETAKTRWNSEVLSLVRWAQGKDWRAVREEAEEGVARLLGVELSREPLPSQEVGGSEEREEYYPAPGTSRAEVKQQLEGRVQATEAEAARRVGGAVQTARETARAMGQEAREVAAEAREVVLSGAEKAQEVVARGVVRAGDAVARGADKTQDAVAAGAERTREAVVKGAEKTREAVAVGAVRAGQAASKGVEKAQDLVERTKAAVLLAEEKAEARADAKLLHLSDIEKALAERYDSARREERLKRSVEEVLRERYIPMDKADNSHLRLI